MARQFNGSARLSLGSPIITAQPFSLAGWFYPTSNNRGWLFSQGNTGNNNDYMGLASDATGTISASASSLASSAFPGTANTYTLNAWNHAACRMDVSGGRAQAVLNGNFGSKGDALAPTSLGTYTHARIGSLQRSTEIQFSSDKYAAIAAWNAYLDDAEIAALAKGFDPRLIRPGALVAFLPFVRDSTLDLKGNAWSDSGTTVADHTRIIGGRKRSLIGRTAAGGGGAATLSGASQIASFTSAATLKALAELVGAPSIAAFTSSGALKALAKLSGAPSIDAFVSSGAMQALAELSGASTIGPFHSSGSLSNPNAEATAFDTILRNRRRRWN